MSTLDYILNKYDLLNEKDKIKIEIPNVGRNDLADILHELNFQEGVEIGVQVGKYSEIICQKNPQMFVHGIDAWTAYVANPKIGIVTSQDTYNRYYLLTQRRMAKYANYEIIRDWSMNAVHQFKNHSLDFVYIDADHEYDHILEDVTEWVKKVRRGGIVAGHDYYNAKSLGRVAVAVKSAINHYVAENKINPLIIWGLSAKIPPTKRDKWLSWSFVKP